MSPRPVATLHGREARAYVAARQAVDIGRHQRTFSASDFVRVTLRYFAGDAHKRAIAAAHKRADKAEARANQLQERVVELEHNLLRHTATPLDDLPPRKVVDLNRREYEVFAMHCEGAQRQVIASELGLDPRTVSNYVSKVAEQVGADAARAAAMVNRNVVQIRVRNRRKAAA